MLRHLPWCAEDRKIQDLVHILFSITAQDEAQHIVEQPMQHTSECMQASISINIHQHSPQPSREDPLNGWGELTASGYATF